MKGLGLSLTLATSIGAFAAASAQTPRTVWSGVYTTAQAAAGADLYARTCAECHGNDLEGIERAPALAGGAFAQRWDRATLKRLFERMEEMPPDDPAARLAPKQYADILAFLLSVNDVPAGAAPLGADKDVLATITFTSRR
jgi:mono/diheme cytochrome c family protein